jgi:D-aspartate ligase
VTPVLVLGGGLTVLGVIRTLGRAGIPACVLSDQQDFVRRSRWYRPAPGAPGGDGRDFDLARFLEASPFEAAVLMPCSDVWVMRVARLEPRLAARFASSQASADALETLLDKGRFAGALREAGVPHPRTEVLAGPADLEAIPDDAFVGSFLKPRDSQHFFQRFGVKAFRVAGRAEAVERLREIGAAGFSVVFQEYIPGPATNHYFVDGFVDRTGQLCAVFARRRLRMYPRDFGNSTFMVSVAADQVAAAVEAVRRLLEHLRYRGIFSAEFKYDERDHLFKILEVNARPWWYVEFAARSGVDVCTMAYRDALGLPVEPVAGYRVGRALVFPYYDFGACRELRRDGALSAWGWARSWLTAERPMFRWSDPFPAAIETATGVGRRLRKMVSRTIEGAPSGR